MSNGPVIACSSSTSATVATTSMPCSAARMPPSPSRTSRRQSCTTTRTGVRAVGKFSTSLGRGRLVMLYASHLGQECYTSVRTAFRGRRPAARKSRPAGNTAVANGDCLVRRKASPISSGRPESDETIIFVLPAPLRGCRRSLRRAAVHAREGLPVWQTQDRAARCYHRSDRQLTAVFMAPRGCFDAVWVGVLSHEQAPRRRSVTHWPRAWFTSSPEPRWHRRCPTPALSSSTSALKGTDGQSAVRGCSVHPKKGVNVTLESGRLLKLREGAVAWQQVDGETILLDLAASTYLGVNQSGSLLWPALVDGSTRQDLMRRLCEAYDVTEDEAAMDVDAFLRTCQERGFLES